MDSVRKRPTPIKPVKALSASELAVSVRESNQTVDYDHYRKLEMELAEARAEIVQLKTLLSKSGELNIAMPVSDEEEIASIQLEKIKRTSRERELTLEEIKKYDLLVKNKRLAQGDVTDITGNKDLPKSLDKTDLIKIAKIK